VQAPARIGPDIAVSLSRITAQTLIVQGTRDASVPAGAGHALKAHIPGAHLSYIHDAGEAIDSDQPARFARLVAAYLDYGPAFIVKRKLS
jgi:pimeloyl-ACP methyl ester carboxylesterase